jgi:hypothetical protein
MQKILIEAVEIQNKMHSRDSCVRAPTSVRVPTLGRVCGL